MTRDVRIEFPGAIYHVTSRGIERGAVFLDDGDRWHFWNRVGQTVQRYGWEMFSASLMTNHFHLFFRTPQPNLSRGMQYLLGGYASWWNRRREHLGHVFQGRFHSQIVEDAIYYWSVSRYVHLNPVPSIVAHPADWPWSTYPGYVDPNRRWEWVAYDTLLRAWQGTFGGKDAVQHYREFVESSLADAPCDPFATAIDGWILGSQEFADRIRQKLRPLHRRRSKKRLWNLDEVLALVCLHFGIEPGDLSKRFSSHPARPLAAFLAKHYSAATLRQIAPVLGLKRPDCVPQLIHRACVAEPNSPLALARSQLENQLDIAVDD